MLKVACGSVKLISWVKHPLARSYAAGASFLNDVPMLKRDSVQVKADDLKNKAIILYFSAGYCGHCRLFTPKLKKWYEEAGKKENIEVVWVSRDKEPEDQLNYYKKALPDVPYIPHGDKHIPEFLAKYEVATIPHAILVNDKGEVVEGNVRNIIQNEGEIHGEKLAKQFYTMV